MKVSYIELLGEKHPLCFSLSATEEICEAFGGTDEMMTAISSADTLTKLKAVSTTLDILMRAGRKYCEVAGLDMPENPLPCRAADVIDITDDSAIKAIFGTFKNDSERTVEAKSKNARPTQGE